MGAAVITAPGVYELSAEEYHADPCPEPSLSAGCGKALIRLSPAHAMASHPRLAKLPIRENKTTFDIGTAAHAMLLHEDRRMFVHDGDSWRGKAADLRDAAYERGEVPMLVEQFDRVREMVELCRAQLAEHEAHGAFDLSAGVAERTVVWREGDVWCRCKPDFLPWPMVEGSIVYDYKSTAASAHPDAWGGKTMWGIGADFGAAFYLRGLRKVFGLQNLRYRFVVQEQKPPHALCVVELDQRSLASAENEVERAIETWRQCLRDDVWPGYPTRVCYVSLPAWEEARRLDRNEREPITPEMMRAVVDWQRPIPEPV